MCVFEALICRWMIGIQIEIQNTLSIEASSVSRETHPNLLAIEYQKSKTIAAEEAGKRPANACMENIYKTTKTRIVRDPKVSDRFFFYRACRYVYACMYTVLENL